VKQLKKKLLKRLSFLVSFCLYASIFNKVVRKLIIAIKKIVLLDNVYFFVRFNLVGMRP
jgi:hypothetical protein